METTSSAKLVQAIEATWQAIQGNNLDTPNVVVTMAGGSSRGALKCGHFAYDRWIIEANHEGGVASSAHELFIGGEGLARGATATLGTLLHEAAHGIAATRGVQDTSRQGRYHNHRFAAIAEEVGIEVQHSESLGWSTTTVPDETAATYADEVNALDEAITAYRRAEWGTVPTGAPGTGPGTTGVAGRPGTGRKSNNNGLALACPCGRKIRASKTVAERAPIICGDCGEPFTPPS
jgi:hypothetical protein